MSPPLVPLPQSRWEIGQEFGKSAELGRTAAEFARRARSLATDSAYASDWCDFSPLSRGRAPAREATGNQRPWPADKVERWSIDRLIPYAKNARTHTDAQVAAIAASIKEWGWTTPALVGEDGGLIAGGARRRSAPMCWPTISLRLPVPGGTRSCCGSNSAS